MANKSIIIIGAGIAGLSAGCYGQMNGYSTRIFELHNLAGGLCTSWKRKGYMFDGCIHYLVGSAPGHSFHRTWQELGAVQGRSFVAHDELLRVEGSGGKTLSFYADPDRLERHMKEFAPGDGETIEELCDAVRRFLRFDPPWDRAPETMGLFEALKLGLKVLPYAGAMRKYNSISIRDFAQRFRDPFLREAFDALSLLFFGPDQTVFAVMSTLALYHNRTAGYPIGGSLEFAQAIERRYTDLGGEIHFKSRVEKSLVEGDRAVGVRLTDGSEHRADMVISAADGHATIFDMLDGKYADETIRGYYEKLPLAPPLVQVSLGVARDLSKEPHTLSFPIDEPIKVGGESIGRLGAVRHYCYDPTAAPEGKSVLVVIFWTNYRYYKDLREDRERYKAEKKQLADEVIARLDKRLPGLAAQVEAVDVATPTTTERYTANWQGAVMGFNRTPSSSSILNSRKGLGNTLPGLDGFYMVGQWSDMSGGVPTVAASGKKVIQVICKRDRKRFVTTLP